MGYSTDFTGRFELDKPLQPEHKAYLERFAYTRRMKRDALLAEKFPDKWREAVGLPIGIEGEYYVGSPDGPSSTDICGQGHDESILNYNRPPVTQPELWCQWVPNDDGTAIVWDGGEKFYSYVEWIVYLIQHFLRPWGYVLNGEVYWNGEDAGDLGVIEVTDNKVEVKYGRVIYE